MATDGIMEEVATAYRARRALGEPDQPAWEAALVAFKRCRPELPEDEARSHVAELIFEASEVYGPWLYGADSCHAPWWHQTVGAPSE